MQNNIFEMRHISKSFVGVKALVDVDFSVYKGEIHALIGENGAGKSTLMKILAGLYPPDEGEIIFEGRPVKFKSPSRALNAGIAMIHQETSLFPLLDVAENIWLGREQRFKNHANLISYKKRYEATTKLLIDLGLEDLIKPTSFVKDIGIAKMQMVELVRAVSYDAKVIIMDEPTSSMTPREVEILYRVARLLTSKGAAIIFISHKLEEIFELCDRVTVFRDGHCIGTNYCKEITMDQLIKMIVNREDTTLYSKQYEEHKEVVLEVKNFNGIRGRFRNVNFSVFKGEVLGFSGLMGAGRTELMQALFGVDRLVSGEVYLEGKQIKISQPSDAIKNGIAMVNEDRLHVGIIPNMSVILNATIAGFNKLYNSFFTFNNKKEKEAFNDISKRLSLKYSSSQESISQLSGGNQQKVILARWLLTNPKILILDEPTRGIDIGTKNEVYRLIDELAKQGMTILFVSSELNELLALCDRILVMSEGEIVYESRHEQFDKEMLISSAFGQVE